VDDHRLAGFEAGLVDRPCQAVTAMTGTEAASTKLSELGFFVSIAADATGYSA
jgi:hypothetical protein